jgi:hypothetical protein
MYTYQKNKILWVGGIAKDRLGWQYFGHIPGIYYFILQYFFKAWMSKVVPTDKIRDLSTPWGPFTGSTKGFLHIYDELAKKLLQATYPTNGGPR